jgi:hypothetical protein
MCNTGEEFSWMNDNEMGMDIKMDLKDGKWMKLAQIYVMLSVV